MRKIFFVLLFISVYCLNAQVIGGSMLNLGTRTTAQMNAITSAQGRQVGSYVDNSDTGTLWRYNGSAWENTGLPSIDASGFSGNLNTGIDDLQKLANAVDTLTVSGSGGETYTFSTGLTNTSGTITVTNPFEEADETKLDGIAAGATVGANWNTNLTNIPADIADGDDDTIADGSETKLSAGTNVTITGTGTTGSPYVINSSGGGTADNLGNHTATQDLNLGGYNINDVNVVKTDSIYGNTLDYIQLRGLGYGMQFNGGELDMGGGAITRAGELTAGYSILNGLTSTDLTTFTSGVRISSDSNPTLEFSYFPTSNQSGQIAELYVGKETGDLYYNFNKGVSTPLQITDNGSLIGDGTGSDDQTASEVTITDSGDNFTATDVEGALAELAASGGSGTDDQQLTLSGNTLTLENGGTPINLAPYLDNTDDQTLAEVLAQGANGNNIDQSNLGNLIPNGSGTSLLGTQTNPWGNSFINLITSNYFSTERFNYVSRATAPVGPATADSYFNSVTGRINTYWASTWNQTAWLSDLLGSNILLTGYTKGSDDTALAATDTANEAFAKLENQIENAVISGGGLTTDQNNRLQNVNNVEPVFITTSTYTTTVANQEVQSGAKIGSKVLNIVNDATTSTVALTNTSATKMEFYHFDVDSGTGQLTFTSANGFVGTGFTGNSVRITGIGECSFRETGYNTGVWRIYPGEGVTFVTIDQTPPSISGSPVVENADPSSLVITYNEALDETSVPNTSSFIVEDPSVNAVTNVSISGSVVTLTLTNPIENGDTVTVGFSVSSGNNIRDLAGNIAGNYTAIAVTNNVAAASFPQYYNNLVGAASPNTETTTNRWISGTSSIETTIVRNGTNALRFTPATAGTENFVYTHYDTGGTATGTSGGPFQVGDVIRFSGWARFVSTVGTLRIWNWNEAARITVAGVNNTGWTYFETEQTVTAITNKRMYIYADQTVIIDDMKVEKVN